MGTAASNAGSRGALVGGVASPPSPSCSEVDAGAAGVADGGAGTGAGASVAVVRVTNPRATTLRSSVSGRSLECRVVGELQHELEVLPGASKVLALEGQPPFIDQPPDDGGKFSTPDLGDHLQHLG